MNALIVDAEKMEWLAELNASGDPARQLQPVTLQDARRALNADLLADVQEGGTWAHYRELVDALELDEIEVGSIESPQVE
jgi:hypothetical protein